MKEIRLTQGKVALVDDEDFEYLNQFKWQPDGLGYVRRTLSVIDQRASKTKTVSMHASIMLPGEDLEVDHINRNRLDNRRCNLRLTNHSMNCVNQKLKKNNKTGYRGIWERKGKKYPVPKWRAVIVVNGKDLHLGDFLDPRNAAQAYNLAAVKYHGNYAQLNNVEFTLEEAFKIVGGYG